MLYTPNDILFKIKKALGLSNEEMLKAYTLENYDMTLQHLENLLKRRQDKGFEMCTFEELGVFLDGFVTLKRGPAPQKQNADEDMALTNNLILKKLRAALQLKEFEIGIIFELVDVELSKQQLSSLFRKEDHKNFKPCSDELLESFLDGLDEFYYDGNPLE